MSWSRGYSSRELFEKDEAVSYGTSIENTPAGQLKAARAAAKVAIGYAEFKGKDVFVTVSGHKGTAPGQDSLYVSITTRAQVQAVAPTPPVVSEEAQGRAPTPAADLAPIAG